MSTKKSQTVKQPTSTIETKKVENVVKINFDKFADKLKNVELTEKKKKERLYNYPENFTEKMINEKEGKQFRAKQRNIIKTFANNIAVFYKYKRTDELLKAVKDFTDYYKKTYRINDFSVNSISQKQDEKTEDIKTMLEIVKELNK